MLDKSKEDPRRKNETADLLEEIREYLNLTFVLFEDKPTVLHQNQVDIVNFGRSTKRILGFGSHKESARCP